ncbi:MAG: hypothetical protein PHT58_07755 [Eubacteriales bacterium]|nr:hypothetical protein [Eubacteriales bacterium]
MPSKKTDQDLPMSASSMECTGMMPTPPKSEEELESYLDLYPTSLPVDSNKV